ncbi:unnamed protein product [Nezara viridula]|uniref:Uncharacterized protein n=1 Tax=Nezara viridula TaxID=85310 RepID=A0A9P0HNS7_NEZVI|nr:unnamed protein product [Nezara viridula]
MSLLLSSSRVTVVHEGEHRSTWKESVWREENPGKGEKYWDEVFRLVVEDLKDVEDYGLLLCMGQVPKSQIRVLSIIPQERGPLSAREG